MHRLIVFCIGFSITGCGNYLKNSFSSGDCIGGNIEFAPAELPETENYRLLVYKNSSLFLFQNGEDLTLQIDSGNKFVFEYQYSKPVNPMMVDAGYTETILFEIDPGLDRFLLSGALLQGAKAVYGNLCFCADAGYHPVSDGCIAGRKTGKNEWQVKMNIKAYGQNREFSKMLSETFKMAK